MLRLRVVQPNSLSEISPVVMTRQDEKIALSPDNNRNVNEIHSHCKFPIKSELHRDLYDALQEKGYQCLTEYIDSKTNVQVICPNGHTWSAPARKLMIPCNNCKECWKINGATAKEKIAQVIRSRGGAQLTPYDPRVTSVKCEAGHTFERPTASINQGAWCTECPPPHLARCKIRFERAVKEKNLIALSGYVGTGKSVHLMCQNGHTYWQDPTDLYRTLGCNHCRGRTNEAGELRFRKYIQDNGGTVVGEYINNCTKVSVICDKGHNFDIAPNNAFGTRWCSKCAGTCPKQAEEKFIRNVALMRGTVIGNYRNYETKVTIRCEFGHQFNMLPGGVNSGSWCPECQGHCPIAAERKFREVVAKRGGTMVGQYVNSYTKISVICAKGHEFKICQGNAVSSGQWCKICGQSESHGERAVREYLVKKSLKYDTEVTFDWYPNGRYDFFFNHNNRNFLVEFDGEQHFSYVYYFHKSEERFNHARQRDINKSRAAIDNGYCLIRIAYTDIFDVDMILEAFIESTELPDKLVVSDYEKYGWLLEALVLLN